MAAESNYFVGRIGGRKQLFRRRPTRGPRGEGSMKTGGSSLYTFRSPSSGTLASTYASKSSRLSSVSMESAMHFEVEADGDQEKREQEEKTEHIKSLVQDFFGAPSANCSIAGGNGNINVLERWFKELGVGWLLDATSGASAGEGEREHSYTFDTQSWIRALAEIMEAIRLMRMPFLFPDDGGFGGGRTSTPKQLQFEQFFQETMLRMLTFVDLNVRGLPVSNLDPLILENLSSLLHVHGALSKAVMEIQCLYPSPPSAQAEWIGNGIVSLLLAKETMAFENIWSTVEKDIVRMGKDHNLFWGRVFWSPLGSLSGTSDIHKGTRIVMANISFLRAHCMLMAPIVSKASRVGNYVPQFGDLPPFSSMLMEMTSCLEERLVKMSESFQDQGLKFLFLLNNSYFVQEQQEMQNLNLPPAFHVTTALSLKVDDYTERYLEVSWAPVLSYLFKRTPLLFWIKYFSSLHMFESQFSKTYTIQKLWKVPNPNLRTRLRNAISEKIIPPYTRYIEDNNITTQKFTPRNLEVKLQLLFEG